jgi:DNA-binding beta-propeller fold protein YncE
MPKSLRLITVSLFCLTAPFLLAQQANIAGPVSGYVFDRTAHSLRPVLGIAGASMLGDGVNFGFPVASVYVSPGQDTAIVAGTDRSLHLFKLSAGTVTEVTLNGLSGVPEGVVFSPSGSTAALFTGGRVQVITGLPNGAALGGTVDARGSQDASALSVRPHPHRQMATEMFAVSDDGALLLVASEGSVRAMQTTGGSQILTESASGALVAFAPGGHDAVVASPTGAGLVVFRDAGGAAQQQVIAAAADIAAADGIAFSADGAKLYVARSSGGVAVFDLAAKSRTDVTCDCVPFGLTPMGTLFRLNEIGTGPLWLLDPTAARIVFVPAKSN